MADWMKVGTDFGVGAIGGVVDQVVQNADNKREKDARALPTTDPGYLAPDKKQLPMMKQVGTYVNYGVALLSVVGAGMGLVKGDMATRLVTVGGAMAGRKLTGQVTAKKPAERYTVWERISAGTPQPPLPPQPQVGSSLEF
jgi:hypothetical protein